MTRDARPIPKSMHETPILTADLPGTGGRIREFPDDFLVEEIPAYEPSGAGDHVYVRLRKRGISTHEAAARLAKAIGRRPRDVGCAGLKDARAVAIQTLSIEHADPAQIESLELPGIEIIEVRRHRNKLKRGHLKGNRFSIRIRGVCEGALDRAQTILETLRRRGAANDFGPQRFGVRGDSDRVGEFIVRGEFDQALSWFLGRPSEVESEPARAARKLYDDGDLAAALRAWPRRFANEKRALSILAAGRDVRQAVRSIPKALRSLLVSAYQSRLFNRLLAQRIAAGATDRLEAGDLAYLHDRGAVFAVEDAAAEQPRADAFEISPSGPLFGAKSLLASGEPGRREQALLDAEGITLETFKSREALRPDGARRPFRMPVGRAEVQAAGDDLVLSFDLPPGSYATSVLAEVMEGGEPGMGIGD